MSAIEQVPLWDRVTHPLASALDYALGCHHRHLSRVFTLKNRSYKVCCDCGARFEYSLEAMSIVHHSARVRPFRRLRALRRWRARHV